MSSPSDTGARWLPVVFRAVLYAAAITALVLYTPGEPEVFVYLGF